MSGRVEAAAVGPLQPLALALAEHIQWFYNERDQGLNELLGRTLPRSAVRDELIRAIVIAFGYGQAHHVSDYQRDLVKFRGRTAVREELDLLASLRLVDLLPDARDRRAILVKPTQRLIDWYNRSAPDVVAALERAVSRLRELSPGG